jgi:hypothetical protein
MAEDSWGGGEGSIAFENCYLRDNNISHLRIASDGTTVDNCVIHNTNNVPLHPVQGGVVNSRGIYTGYGEYEDIVEVRNTHIDVTPDNTNGGASAVQTGYSSTWGRLSQIYLTDCQIKGSIGEPDWITRENVGSDPSTSIPVKCPTDAVSAASGSTGSTLSSEGETETAGTIDRLPNTVTITGTGSPANYGFSVDGEVGANPEEDTLESWDTIDGSSAAGWVTTSGHVDSYRFSGSITNFEFTEGDATVEVNGTQVDPATLGTANDEPIPHTLTIEGTGAAANYVFTVSDSLSGVEDSIETWDTIEDTSAEGWVTTAKHADAFEFTGELTSFEFLQGSATVYVDGAQVDTTAL